MIRDEPKPLERWRHCKGMVYTIVDLATHTETEEEMVLYRVGPATSFGRIWARPLSMFMDRHSSGAWRFERVTD